jgi:hypothetical protein
MVTIIIPPLTIIRWIELTACYYSIKSPGTIDIKSAKLDFIHPFGHGWNFEAGAK